MEPRIRELSESDDDDCDCGCAYEDPEGYPMDCPTGEGPLFDCEPWLTNG